MGTTASPDASTATDREVLTWQGFGDASRELTKQIVDSGWVPDLIVAIARGGLIPAGAIDSGKTLKMVMDLIDEHGLSLDGSSSVHVEARSAVIYKKPVSIIEPDYVWAYTDKWINFPWSTLPVIKP